MPVGQDVVQVRCQITPGPAKNDFLLTHGQYPVDLALHTSLNKDTDSSRGVDFEFGPAMQTEFGQVQANANVFLERTYRVTPASRMQMKYQWQGKYHLRARAGIWPAGLW